MGSDFGWDDAALLGGTIGFAEESVRKEDEIPESPIEDSSIELVDPINADDTIIRLFKSGHPREYEWLVRRIIEQRLEWAAAEKVQPQDSDEAAFLEEIYDKALQDEDFT